jgi:ABC-2 type transport system permease protein
MKMLQVARKTILEAWREPQLFGLLLVFPALLIMIYFYAFGGANSQGMSQYITVMVYNQDAGPHGTELIQAMREAQFDGKAVFTLQFTDNPQDAQMPLKEHKLAMLLTIPPNFSQKIEAARTGGSEMAVLRLDGDPTADMYVFASGFLGSVVDELSNRLTNWQGAPVASSEFVENTGKTSDFQFGVPGVLVFGVLFIMISSAIVLVREEVNGSLQRLRVAGASALDIIGGVALAHMFYTLLQLLLALGVGTAYGFKSPGSIPLTLLVGMVVSLLATGLGMLAAAFTHSDGEAANLATGLMVPMAFLSGAVFPMPPMPIAQIGGVTISVFDMLPTTHASNMMRRILIYGDGLGQLVYPGIALLVLSAIYILVGAWFYQRRRLS